MGKTKKSKNTDTNAPDIRDIDPTKLTLAPDVQPRCRMNKPLIETYSQAMKDGDQFPAVVAFDDGEALWVADGFHRTRAAIMAGLTTIKVEVHEGGKRDAILFAVSSNSTHGLRRTNADKRRAVERLLTDEEWSDWPAREIARQCRVSNTFVSKLRREASVNGAQMGGRRKVTRGGKTYEMDTSNIGRKDGDDGGQSDEEDGAGADGPESGSADPDNPDDPNEEITGQSANEEESANDTADDPAGALDGILSEVRNGGDDEDGDESEDGAGATAGADDEVDGDEVPEEQDNEPDDVGGTTASTDSGDNYSPTSESSAPSDIVIPATPARWALVRVSGSSFTDEQADTVRGCLDDGPSHVLVVKEGSGTSGYPAFKDACDVLEGAGFPLQFNGRLLLAGKHVVWTAVACRVSEDDLDAMLQQVLGWGMGEIPGGRGE